MAVVHVDNVSKRFTLHKDRADTMGQMLWRMLPGKSRFAGEPFWALKGVSFDMTAGKSMGIIGNNGSGKSTLLKIVTRTMRPSNGNVSVQGRVSALIELGAGFHPDFTGRENVVLNASLLGISRRDINRRMEEIIEFAEIRPFMDVPVKYYSSGMHARLGFAVAIHVEPEILIVDEVLAVGDESFQRKCMDRILAMKRDGTSILLVSHDLGAVERLMDEAIWLDGGVVEARGEPRGVIQAYRQRQDGVQARPERQAGLRLQEAYCSSLTRRHGVALPGEPVELVLTFRNDTAETFAANVDVRIRRDDGFCIADLASERDDVTLSLRPGDTTVVLHMDSFVQVDGTYSFDVEVTDRRGGRLFAVGGAAVCNVASPREHPHGAVLTHAWRVLE